MSRRDALGLALVVLATVLDLRLGVPGSPLPELGRSPGPRPERRPGRPGGPGLGLHDHAPEPLPASLLALLGGPAAGASARGAGPAHAASLLGHALNAALVFLLARACFRAAGAKAGDATSGPALVAALFFALHPLRVEVVAWASAFPYVLALAFLLVAPSCTCAPARARVGIARVRSSPTPLRS